MRPQPTAEPLALHPALLLAKPIEKSADRPLELALPMRLTFDLKGGEYVCDWALPQFYFHVLMAYGILRSRGVPLGKADYVPHMGRYLRG